MASWLTRTAQFWSEWGLRIAVYSSFLAHVVLVVLARSRRRPSRWGTTFLWAAYQITEIAATYALGKLSLSGTDALSRKHQLIAFWAPFLLLHLGGPDNITAYALEDNMLSLRKWLEIIVQVLGSLYTLYNYIYLGDSRILMAASGIMFSVGFAKYTERACALYWGDLGNMRSSVQKQQSRKILSERLDFFTRGRELDNEKALLFAHDLFRFCRRAMVDSSVVMDPLDQQDTSGVIIFSLGWRSMSRVVEMELSLMFDILYTKAAVIHTWVGYLIRLISPLATATAASLFRIYPKHDLHTADVLLTYILLAAAFLLDGLWLVRALGSNWTHAFLTAQPVAWLHHAVLCNGRWRWFHRVVSSLDPCWLFGKDPSSYRRWPGITGRYNLLHESTRAHGGTPPLCSWLATKVGLDTWKEHQYLCCLFKCQQDVKKMLFERIKQRLLPLTTPGSIRRDDYTMKDITTRWGQKAVHRRPKVLRMLKITFGREFQEDILVWHIGTCIFLSCTDEPLVSDTYVKAIELLSEYLMFLVAVRPHMLPGLVLHSLFEVTFQALGKVWGNGKKNGRSSRSRKENLAKILHKERFENDRSLHDAKTHRLMWDGTELGIELLKLHEQYMSELLELILDVWVDKLMYAGTRCSRLSHAKQLSQGGELTTIVWIMVEHAGPFRIGEKTSYVSEIYEEKMKEEEEKKKKEEEKKPATGDEPPRWPVQPPSEAIEGERPMPPAPPPSMGSPILSAKARKRLARTTTYATLYRA